MSVASSVHIVNALDELEAVILNKLLWQSTLAHKVEEVTVGG